ncbi:alpha/beta fold hydrolase [Aspergillus homomorphus CBS 101889]|uniref:Alpha/beta hydrolase n=1 Tax=Aspergillus homomorphus (strain CBS 101889) TaxID=1450537 RepID=A0A395HYV4_ASPHC|nr:alpha/beta hydrolase [Aspergillus homomorphus CBS 101889]RAL12877.1 alpha/beta hydrolase [Aspergillus homomorphus CBS 101889]
MNHFKHKAYIGTHSLSYALRGRARQPGAPLIIILTGITSSALEWSAVCRHLESEATILLYERSGYGLSDLSPNDPDSLTIVDELSRLLAAASLEPPYLLVGHSWGGILAREFIAARPVADICGLVLVDPVQERMLFETWPDPSVAAVTDGLDYMEVVGLTQDYKLAESEWRELMAEEASAKHAAQAEKELPFLQVSRKVLAEKWQLVSGRSLLGAKPVSVLRGNSKRDQERMYEAGVANGGGTEAQRAQFREYLARWDESEERFQRELLNLSSTARLSYTARSGHNIQITEPDRVADEIHWVLQRVV